MHFRWHNKISALGLPRVYVPLSIGLLLLVFPIFISHPFILHMMILNFFLAYLAASWNIVAGYAGQLSLCHPAYIGIGAYTSTLLFNFFGLSPWIGLFAGGLIALSVGLLVGLPTLKLRGGFYALGTLAFGETLRILFLGTTEIGGAVGYQLQPITYSWQDFQFFGNQPYYYISFAMLTVIILITYRIEKSRTGLRLVALREDEEAAATLGINTTKYKLTAVAISAFLIAIGGTFYAQFYYVIEPNGVMGLQLGLQIYLIAQIGGLGTVFGAVLGSFFLTPVAEFFRATFASGTYFAIYLIMYGAVLCGSIIMLPRGLAPAIARLYDKMLRKLPSTET